MDNENNVIVNEEETVENQVVETSGCGILDKLVYALIGAAILKGGELLFKGGTWVYKNVVSKKSQNDTKTEPVEDDEADEVLENAK